MILADTGFFVALAQPRDALHSRAAAWTKAVTERILVTEYVVWETVNYLSAPVDQPKAHALVKHVDTAEGYEFVAASAALCRAGLKQHAWRSDKGLVADRLHLVHRHAGAVHRQCAESRPQLRAGRLRGAPSPRSAMSEARYPELR